MEQRDFLGDEVHMMQSDIKALRSENSLLKMKTERQDEMISSLREENVRLRATCETKTIELASLQSVLESVGQLIKSGLDRYLARRDLKRETVRLENEKLAASGSDIAGAETLIASSSESETPATDHPLLPRVRVGEVRDDGLLEEDIRSEVREMRGVR